jgi:glycosyltransferase involved in cell wall biosynthesis
MAIRFSVIIPVYNREQSAAATIQSALDQDLPPHQVIVVDDGSTDGSADAIEQFGDAVEFYRQPNQGCAAARNLALKHSTGEYLAFLDSDDIWYPWTLRLMSQVIEEHGRPPVLATARLIFEGEAPPQIDQPSELKVKVLPDVLSAGRVVATCVLVIRRDVLEQAGGFVPIQMNGTDAELNLRIGTCGPLVDVLAPPMLAYRKHEANVMRNLDNTYRGQIYMADQERAGKYPGGRRRRSERIGFITSQTRPLSLHAVRGRQFRFGWPLYWRTFAWNLRLGRLRYLIGFPWTSFLSRWKSVE